MVAMAVEYVIESLGHLMIGPIACLEDALRIASGDTFDCAIIDVNIRGGFTFAVADILTAKGRPFLLATGYGELSLPVNLRQLPRLDKPYSEKLLTEQVNLLVKRVLC